MKIKRGYEQRVREIEHGSFTPLVFSLTGGIGKAATVFLQETRFADCCETGAFLQQHVILAEMLVKFCASEVCNPMHQGGSFLHWCRWQTNVATFGIGGAETNFSA